MAGSVQHTSGRNLTNSPRFELYNDDDDDDDDEDGNDGDDDDDVGDGVKKDTFQVCPATADGSSVHSSFWGYEYYIMRL